MGARHPGALASARSGAGSRGIEMRGAMREISLSQPMSPRSERAPRPAGCLPNANPKYDAEKALDACSLSN